MKVEVRSLARSPDGIAGHELDEVAVARVNLANEACEVFFNIRVREHGDSDSQVFKDSLAWRDASLGHGSTVGARRGLDRGEMGRSEFRSASELSLTSSHDDGPWTPGSRRCGFPVLRGPSRNNRWASSFSSRAGLR